MVNAEIVERGIGICTHVECSARASGFDIPDVDVAEVGKPLLFIHTGGEYDPVRRNILHPRRKRRIAITRIPIHGDVNRNGDAYQSQIMYANVRRRSAPCVRGLEEHAGRNSAERGDVVDLDIAKASRSLAADGDSRRAVANDRVAQDNVFSWPVHTQSIGVAASFEAQSTRS